MAAFGTVGATDGAAVGGQTIRKRLSGAGKGSRTKPGDPRDVAEATANCPAIERSTIAACGPLAQQAAPLPDARSFKDSAIGASYGVAAPRTISARRAA